jgi:hypothetical protein
MEKGDKVAGHLECWQGHVRDGSTEVSVEELRLGPFLLKGFRYVAYLRHRQGCMVAVGLALVGLFGFLMAVLLNVL